MSWPTDDGAHEGYVLPEFGDGARGTGTTGGGIPADQVIVDVTYIGEPGAITDTRYTTRPAGEVIGWRVMCDCRDQDSGRVTSTWASELLTRVPSKALQDLDAGRLFVASDEDVPYVDELEPFEDLFRRLWRREHVDRLDSLDRIREARRRARAAERDLDEAVAAGRAAGHSWEAIGAATGMARQSAHGRWG